eukprot:GHVT01014045.1.p1 GENE.GHVT01014045.1~~GHVT01014045.1.p1  ORF type:complete len:403 (-),score=91.77 GHVT01014045.1:523-1731(-)
MRRVRVAARRVYVVWPWMAEGARLLMEDENRRLQPVPSKVLVKAARAKMVEFGFLLHDIRLQEVDGRRRCYGFGQRDGFTRRELKGVDRWNILAGKAIVRTPAPQGSWRGVAYVYEPWCGADFVCVFPMQCDHVVQSVVRAVFPPRATPDATSYDAYEEYGTARRTPIEILQAKMALYSDKARCAAVEARVKQLETRLALAQTSGKEKTSRLLPVAQAPLADVAAERSQMLETITAANMTFKFVRDSMDEQRAEHQAAVAELKKLVEDVRAEQDAKLDALDGEVKLLWAKIYKEVGLLKWEVEDRFAERCKLEEDDACNLRTEQYEELDSLQTTVDWLYRKQTKRVDSLKTEVGKLRAQLREFEANRAPPATQAHAGTQQPPPPPPPKQSRKKNRIQKNRPT